MDEATDRSPLPPNDVAENDAYTRVNQITYFNSIDRKEIHTLKYESQGAWHYTALPRTITTATTSNSRRIVHAGRPIYDNMPRPTLTI